MPNVSEQRAELNCVIIGLDILILSNYSTSSHYSLFEPWWDLKEQLSRLLFRFPGIEHHEATSSSRITFVSGTINGVVSGGCFLNLQFRVILHFVPLGFHPTF